MIELFAKENKLALQGTALDDDLRHPALFYIAKLQSPASQKTMREVLSLVAGRFAGWFGIEQSGLLTFPWHLLEAQHVTYYMRVREQEDGCKHTTINKELAAIKGVALAAWDLELIDTDRLQRIQRVKSARGNTLLAGRAIGSDELNELFHYLSELKATKPRAASRDAAIFAILYSGSGPRREELIKLDLCDFDDEEGTITIRAGKGNKSRVGYLSLPNREAVCDWIVYRGTAPGPLFGPISKGDNILRDSNGAPLRLGLRSLNGIIERRCRQASVAHFTPHDCRRTAVTDMLNQKADVTVVQRLVGHADPSTTYKYNRQAEAKAERTSRLIRAPYEG